MLLSKKDTPAQFIGMWYAGLLNLVVTLSNLGLYFFGHSWTNLILACFSLMVTVVIFVVIKRQTRKILWEKLTESE